MSKRLSQRSIEKGKARPTPQNFADRIFHGDCLEVLNKLPAECIDLVFADPPFNINYAYDFYRDDLQADQYVAFSRAWMQACMRALKPTGSFYIAIGDEYAAEIRKLIDELGGHFRNWIIWHVTFGQAMQKKFSRSHVHIFYFTASKKGFTFNADLVRVPSARQTTYNDRRANKNGKLPDDTWVLRPQEDATFFQPDQDTWYVSRVCGTFSERQRWHNCQMPEALLERIIKASSNEGDIVLDPFSGSGTTCVVAKRLRRRYVGIELSKNYVKKSLIRLADVAPAPADLPFTADHRKDMAAMGKLVDELRQFGYEDDPEMFREAISDYMFNAYGSWTVDDLLCHPTDAIEFCNAIRASFGKQFSDAIILKTLLNMRKRG